MWRRRGTGLTYTALAWHKLLPPPSRSVSSAAANVISAAAAVWRPGRGRQAVGKENETQQADSGSVILRRRFGSSSAAADSGSGSSDGLLQHGAAGQNMLGLGISDSSGQPAASAADATAKPAAGRDEDRFGDPSQ